MKIFVLSTTTQDVKKSTSVALADAAVRQLAGHFSSPVVRFVDASKLHIVENLSCYASGAKLCADPKAGKYRCWAHHLSQQDPAKYGGKDEMGVIYDNLDWCDIFVFVTSNRWGSHSALAQKIIERMNTIENRSSVYGEPYIMSGKSLGIVVAGLHWETARIGEHLQKALRWFGFSTPQDNSNVLMWQRSRNPYFEHPQSDRPAVVAWIETEEGQQVLQRWADAVAAAGLVP